MREKTIVKKINDISKLIGNSCKNIYGIYKVENELVISTKNRFFIIKDILMYLKTEKNLIKLKFKEKVRASRSIKNLVVGIE